MGSASFPSVLGASIQTAELDDLSVTAAKIANATITAAKMSGVPLVAIQEAVKASNQGITSIYPTYEDVTTLSITLPTKTGGKAIIVFCFMMGNNTLADPNYFQVLDNGVAQEQIEIDTPVANLRNLHTITYVTTLSGQVVKLQAAVLSGSTCTVYGVTGGSGGQSYVQSLEVS